MTTFSVLTPLDFGRRPHSLFERVRKLAIALHEADIQLVIGHAARGGPFDDRLHHELGGMRNVRIASEPAGLNASNLSRLRNNAAALADGDIILLLDADIFPDIPLFRALAAQVRENRPMVVAPCLYLSSEGTARIEKGEDKAFFIESALAFQPDWVLHWAIPSSVIALPRADYHAIGGFCEEYEGYGYEDFDFMLRLAFEKGVLQADASLLFDRPYRAPLLSQGFRAALGQLCMSTLMDDLIAIHLFHEKDQDEDYYRSRTDNGELFRNRFAWLSSQESGKRSMPPVLTAFYEECARRDEDPLRYQALFDGRPRYLLKRRPYASRLWRQFRRHASRAFAR